MSTPVNAERLRKLRVWARQCGQITLTAEDVLDLVDDIERLNAERNDYAGRLRAADVNHAAAVRQRDRLAEQMAIVEKFCAERAESITAIENCHPENSHDYWRWQGHAEKQRQLAERLGLPVAWPPGHRGGAS